MNAPKQLYMIELHWNRDDGEHSKPLFITDEKSVSETLNELSHEWSETVSKWYADWRKMEEREPYEEAVKKPMRDVFGEWAEHIGEFEAGYWFEAAAYNFAKRKEPTLSEKMLDMGYSEEDVKAFESWVKKTHAFKVKPGRTKNEPGQATHR